MDTREEINTTEYKERSLEETFKLLESSINGLTDAEAKKRLELFGKNEIVEKKRNAFLDFLLRYWGPMPWLLELAMVLSFILGHYNEGIIIFVLLSINAIIGHFQAHNSQKSNRAFEG